MTSLVSFYLSANFLILIAYGLSIFLRSSSDLRKRISHGLSLKLHYGFLSLSLLVLIITPLLPKPDFFPPIAKVWSDAEPKRFLFSETRKSLGSLELPLLKSTPLNEVTSNAAKGIAALLFLFFAMQFFRFLREIRKLRSISKRALCVRSIRRVRIYVDPQIQIPFSFWLPFTVAVVIPESLVSTTHFRCAVLHELQHHRQSDTRWVHAMFLLRFLFFLNPAIYRWFRKISETQEFACDETLVDRKKVEPQAYARCLLEVAKTAIDGRREPACATGLAYDVDRSLLKRRIESMFEPRNAPRKSSKSAVYSLLIAGTIILGAGAYASQNFIADRRLSVAEANQMLERASRDGEFPLQMNDRVLKWLNYYLGTPTGREKVDTALKRMEIYRNSISKKIEEYGAPEELLAIPFIEAGYENAGPKKNPYGAAGLWQFIASTARIYGLTVNAERDDRLDVGRATDAALRYLTANKLRFNDWQLSALAYNAGESAVQSAIQRTGSRDPWVIVRSGRLSEESTNYLPKLIAGILIIKNRPR